MDPPETADRRSLETQLYADFLRIVLEIINAILTNALPSNPELVYTLLHRQEVFAPFRADPRYSELMENVTLVVELFGKKVEEAAGDGGGGVFTADRVLEVIKMHSRGWRRDRLRAFPELRFTYEEGELLVICMLFLALALSFSRFCVGRAPFSHLLPFGLLYCPAEASPSDFFVPYVWSIAAALPAIPWTLSAITAFVPMLTKEEGGGAVTPARAGEGEGGLPTPQGDAGAQQAATNV